MHSVHCIIKEQFNINNTFSSGKERISSCVSLAFLFCPTSPGLS